MYAVFAVAILVCSSAYVFVETQDTTRYQSHDRSHVPPALRKLEPCEVEGYAEDPTNCARFYRCVNYGTEDSAPLLLRHKFKCAAGTIFDTSLSNCNHPDKMTNLRGCQAEIYGGPGSDDRPVQSRQRGRSFTFDDDSNTNNENESNVIQIRRLARTKFRGSNSVSEEADSAPGGEIDAQYLRPQPLVRREFLNNFVSYSENRTTAARFETTKETTFGDYEEVTEPAPFVPHQIQVPYI